MTRQLSLRIASQGGEKPLGARFVRNALSVALLISSHALGSGLDPDQAITQYVSDIWRSHQGLPQDSVRAVTQTRDGYLWLGTQEGLARFDGVRFEVFDKRSVEEMPSSSITSLCESADRALWIGTNAGLLRYEAGAFSLHTTRQGLPANAVSSLYCSPDDLVWIGTAGGGLVRHSISRQDFETFAAPSGLSNSFVTAIAEDDQGRIWVGTQGGGVNLFQDGRFRSFAENPDTPHGMVQTVVNGMASGLWVGTRRGVYRKQGEGFERVPVGDDPSSEIVNVIYEDSRGTIWIGTRAGLFRYARGRFEAFGSSQGLVNDIVMSIFEDREGSLWIGTRDGLHRLKQGAVAAFTTLEGLSSDIVWGVLEDAEGTLWIATGGGGVSRLHKGEFTQYPVGDGPAAFVWTMLLDSRGRLFAGTGGSGIFILEKGRFQPWMSRAFGDAQIWAMAEDRQGAVWVGTEGRGLVRVLDGQAETLGRADGFPASKIRALATDSNGDLWIGTAAAGLYRYSGGRFTVFDESHGLGSNHILSVQEDSQGLLWAGTNGGGVSLIRDGEVITLGTRDGLISDVVYSILEDGQGSLWMSTAQGICRVSRRPLMARLRGGSDELDVESFGKSQGMKGVLYSGTQPASCRSRDGRLWFASQKGLAMIDPGRIQRNLRLPPVLIEKVQVDGKELEGRATPLELPAGARRLEICYTALSLLDPSRVRFRYRLADHDEQWIEAGRNRRAIYSGLPPGKYEFRVVASNNDGVWNERGAALQLSLPPRFHQTPAFWVIASLLLGILIWGAIRLRVRELKRRNLQLSLEVAERRRAEEALRRSEERLRGYFEMPLVGFSILSPEMRLIDVNDRLCRILGFSKYELLQKDWFELLHLDERQYMRDALSLLLSRRTDSFSNEQRCVSKDGRTVYVKLSVARVHRPDGSLDHCVCVVQDLTESKRMEQQLRDSQKMEAVGRLAGGVAHDFNNILTVISGYGELLREAVSGQTRLARQVDSMLDAAGKASSLTRQLLAFSRRQVLNPRLHDLNRLVTEMTSLLQRLIGEDIKLTTHLAADLAPVRVDASQIEQVLMNLAVNARDAMPEGGKLEIETRNITVEEDHFTPREGPPAGAYVMASVRDWGAGMDALTRERAFEPFYTTKLNGKGTGLGLATVYGIVKQSGGFIYVDSVLGRGTTFRIYLPPVQGYDPPVESEILTKETVCGRETILVAEDDPGIRGLIEAALSKNGYRILCAESGSAALKIAEENRMRIDLLLTDVVMPGMGGKELAVRLSQSVPGLRVVFMSGYSQEAIDRHGVLEPGARLIQKPFTPRALAAAIRESLDDAPAS